MPTMLEVRKNMAQIQMSMTIHVAQNGWEGDKHLQPRDQWEMIITFSMSEHENTGKQQKGGRTSKGAHQQIRQE